MIKFNIVLPTIGRDTLPFAIDSVLSQSHRDFNLIISCDTKQAWDMTRDFTDPRIFVLWDGNLQSHRDQGAFARNFAIKMIGDDASQWVTYIDCDDEWYVDRLKLFNDFIENNNFALDAFYSYGKLYKWKHVSPRSSEKVLKPIQEVQHATCGGMCHKLGLFLKTSGWSTTNIFAHDTQLWNEMMPHSIYNDVLKKVTYKFVLEK